MILWNTSNAVLDGMYDGKGYSFAAGEKKRQENPDIYNHLFFKLESYGLVLVPEDISDEKEIQKYKLLGVTARRKMLDARLRNFNTMNKDREANKLTKEPPSDIIIETCDELEQIDAFLNEINKGKLEKANHYLDSNRTENAEKSVSGRTDDLLVDGKGIHRKNKKASASK